MTGDMASPGRLGRLAGAGAILGAIIWPFAIANVAATAIPGSQPGAGPGVEGSIGPLAISLLLFCGAIASLEVRATGQIGLWDLIGDLTIGTATIVLLLASVLGSSSLIGPGFVLLFVGSIIFGVTGYAGRRRPRLGSAMVGLGAAGLVVCLLLAGALGAERLDGVTQTALLSLVFYAVGWGWLGLHLALARPLAPSPDQAP